MHSSPSSRAIIDFDAVAAGIADKLERRHPHVFAAATRARSDWEAIKAEERGAAGRAGVLDDVPLALPALMRATKLGKRAATVGFDWPDAGGARAKMLEELAEVDAAAARSRPRSTRKWAICCWPSPASRGICAWIPKPRCDRPTSVSRPASRPWNRLAAGSAD